MCFGHSAMFWKFFVRFGHSTYDLENLNKFWRLIDFFLSINLTCFWVLNRTVSMRQSFTSANICFVLKIKKLLHTLI